MAFYLQTSCLPSELVYHIPIQSIFHVMCFGRGQVGTVALKQEKYHSYFVWLLPLNCYGYLLSFPDCTTALDPNPLQGSPLFYFPFLFSDSIITMLGFNDQDFIPISDIGFYSLLEYKLQMLLWLNLTHTPGCQDSVKALTGSSCCLLSTLGFWYKQTKKGLKKREFRKPNCLKCGALESWCKRWGKQLSCQLLGALEIDNVYQLWEPLKGPKKVIHIYSIFLRVYDWVSFSNKDSQQNPLCVWQKPKNIIYIKSIIINVWKKKAKIIKISRYLAPV